MKKTLLAAALLAGFAGAAQAADSSVTLYGLLDGGLAWTKDSGGHNQFGPANGGAVGPLQSRFGLKGTEDLGGGLSAIFQIESRFNPGNGTIASAGGNRLFGGATYVGLKSDSWGALTFGRQTNFTDDWGAGSGSTFNPFDTDYGYAGGAQYGDLGFDYGRVDNSIKYVTPTINGFTAGLLYSFNADSVGAYNNTTGVASNGNRLLSAGVDYQNGPLEVSLTYEYNRLPSSVGGASFSGLGLGLGYDFGVAKLYAGYEHAFSGIGGGDSYLGFYSGDPTAADYRTGRANAFSIGVDVPVGTATTIKAAYIYSKLNASGARASDVFGLGVNYNLSKRTIAYVTGGYIVHENWEAGNGRQLVVGLQHSF